MKTLGLLGGMSWESTSHYYRLINEGVKAKLGGLHSAKIVLYSVDFDEIETLQNQGAWQQAGELLADAAATLDKAGAQALLICTNTMHKVAPAIEAAINIPLLHIADATGAQIKANGLHSVGLLGTAFTMQEDFYKSRLTSRFGVNVLTPDPSDMDCVHRVIYEELCRGEINAASRQRYLEIIDRLKAKGAEAIILGCTEIGLLVGQEHTNVPLLDTTEIHAQAAVTWALENPKP